MFISSPLAQFDVVSMFTIFLKNYEMTVTNLSITIFIVLFLLYNLLYFFNFGHMMPSMWQKLGEMLFMFIYRLVYQQLGKKGMQYLPFLFALFMFMLSLNLYSLLPYGFAVTSHFMWTVYFSVSICFGIFMLGLMNYNMKFFKMFVPEVPLFLYLLMMPIEIFSYMLSSFSLGMRLSANIISGHILVHIMADFVLLLCKANQLIVVMPFFFLLAICVLELGLACLQAYMFTILVSIYLNDSVHFAAH